MPYQMFGAHVIKWAFMAVQFIINKIKRYLGYNVAAGNKHGHFDKCILIIKLLINN